MSKSTFIEKIRNRIHFAKKNVLQYFNSYDHKKKILFIIGCQRSGTTLMERIFENDYNSKTFGEFSVLSSNDKNNIRLNSFDSLNENLRNVRPSFIVMKPLVESQNILTLFEIFSDSQALWMYRDFKDVAASNLKKFGLKNGINDLRPIIHNDSSNWRSENISEHVRKTVMKFFSEEMDPYDAAVLFWFARNSLFFDLNLDQSERVILCKYEELVKHPKKVMSTIYDKTGQQYPGERIHGEISVSSLDKGKSINILPEIETIAIELMEKLNSSYNRHKLH